jgi:hypothetical protein
MAILRAEKDLKVWPTSYKQRWTDQVHLSQAEKRFFEIVEARRDQKEPKRSEAAPTAAEAKRISPVNGAKERRYVLHTNPP